MMKIDVFKSVNIIIIFARPFFIIRPVNRRILATIVTRMPFSRPPKTRNKCDADGDILALVHLDFPQTSIEPTPDRTRTRPSIYPKPPKPPKPKTDPQNGGKATPPGWSFCCDFRDFPRKSQYNQIVYNYFWIVRVISLFESIYLLVIIGLWSAILVSVIDRFSLFTLFGFFWKFLRVCDYLEST